MKRLAWMIFGWVAYIGVVEIIRARMQQTIDQRRAS
jgi:hypothetical protein